MKFEKLNKSKDGKIIFIAGFIMAIILIIIINFFFTKAKYQVTSNIQIVKGKVSYNLADLNVLALQVQESENSETYKSTDEVPSGDYEVNKDKSYCTIGSNTNQLKDIPMEYKAGKVSISITKKGTKCYVFLDFKKTPSKVILANSPTQGDIGDITGPSCSGSLNSTCYSVSDDGKRNNMAQNGVFDTIDDYGKTYVFRGFVQNNWVKFGKKDSDDIWWRIIRVNGNGTLRLIYAGTGTTAPATDTSVTQTTTKAFNNDYQDNRYVGFMYGNSNNTYESTHKY